MEAGVLYSVENSGNDSEKETGGEMTKWNGLELPESYYADNNTYFIKGDCLDVMSNMHSIADLVVADPPYFLPANHYQTRTQFSRNFSDLGILEHFFKDCFSQFNQAVKDTGTLYVFCDGQSYPLFYYHLYPYCKNIRPLVWDKLTSINGYSWRHQHELIIFAERANAKPVPSGDGDILKCRATPVKQRIHGAQKPIELLKMLISKSSNPNSIILDPFAGSGSTGLAAQQCGRKSILIESSEEYCEAAVMIYLRSLSE